ncbi:threonine/serine dehydratase [Allokutzneria sp. A3M-2-11 16]|uniref:threonine/serine dehydratase n=1 Tax=Allokutzneria sp. A3M-2-11 16 TaxID=2962043 RepID=UPI0020B6AB0A|nr:threonine/serine dehydratase [Allokutzneria sp. A3M-2-11 16]MCP3805324.1 threonine/serine dehydratase [Allokutzneria sp. A3M-2-11 16]
MTEMARGIAQRSQLVAPKLRKHLNVTPLLPFSALGAQVGAELLVKCEHLQHTGSFKARGALAKALTFTPEQRRRGVVTASSGNHGLGVANALAALGGQGVVFVPENASPVKVAAIERLGARVRRDGTDVGVLEQLAREYAAEHDMVYIPPYNDPEVIAGQGTVAVEMLEQTGKLDAVVVAVGGGGLVGGVASVLKQHWPDVRIIGASPANDAGMVACVRAGEVVWVDAEPTLSEGTAGNIEPGSITVELCRSLVDDWVLVDETAIASALRMVIDTEHHLVEGAAAVAFAAALAKRDELTGQRVAVVSCGANISADLLAEALSTTNPPNPG